MTFYSTANHFHYLNDEGFKATMTGLRYRNRFRQSISVNPLQIESF